MIWFKLYSNRYNLRMSNFLNLNMIILVIFLILTSPKSFANSSWTIESNWDFNLTHPQFKASSVDAVNKCRLNPDSLLSFPVLLYGAHEIFLDNKSILKFSVFFANDWFRD